jgi:4-hydroxy-tetrahydrodipicolinate reductase
MMPLRIAVVGPGRMGREVASLLAERGHEALLVRKGEAFPKGFTVGIDFTRGAEVIPNLEAALRAQARYVVGTTGFELEKARALVEAAGGGFVHAANFSLGVHLFYRIVRHAASLLARFPEYDPYVLEKHHRHKRDAPSGTAKVLAGILEKEVPGRKASESPILDERAFHVSALRAGGIVGEHTVGFDSPQDEIVL